MDTGLSPHLEAVIAAHPGWMIGQNDETKHWEAIRRPTAASEHYVHAGTLDELDARLAAEDGPQ